MERHNPLKRFSEKVAIQKAAAEKGAEEELAAEKAVVEAVTSGSRATEAFEACAHELPRPPEDAAAENIDMIEASLIEAFRKGALQEEELRKALGQCAGLRATGGLGPSNIREIDIVETRLVIAKSFRKAKGGVGETTKKARNHRPHPRLER